MATEATDKDESTAEAGQGLGGARADFVASLGRKVADARKVLDALEGDPSSPSHRDDLRRKLHALGTSARMMRFDAMAQALAEAEAQLEAAAETGGASMRSLSEVARTLDDLPALAWTEPRRAAEAAAPPPEELSAPVVSASPPMTGLVVGPESVAEALVEEAEGGVGSRALECERTEDAQAALGLARSYAPDVVILDASVPDAGELIEALADDPLTEPVPVVVVGKLDHAAVARFTALGVARTVTEPYTGEALRSICEEVVDQREGRTVRMSLGEPTIEQLGDRLADELRRALVDSVDVLSRAKRVSLGEGTEVMAALWGAIARVREVVTARTGGGVRFAGRGPEGSVALAFQPEVPGADRTRRRGAAADVSLEGRRVVVADDNPGVTWFLSDLLRTTGCVVHEALDGETALDLALRLSPDVVISDILMPKMDGFALSRALKRDVALRDMPVILLSWKEDLLQRVRELGASAAAYLRKESDARAILARVREVLWPRARVEARLKGTGEVRGRLDGLTVRSLLEFVSVLRQNARVSVRDASCLYEVELRDGAPRRATRTAGDGGFLRGPRVLGEMLGIGAGRFVVAPATPGAMQGGLSGTLHEQLQHHIAAARGAMATTTGAQTTRVARVTLDPDALETYLRATPEPARSLIVRIAKGASPRDLLLEGRVVPSLLDDVLVDLAARGAMTAVVDEEGQDLLGPAVESALATLRGSPPRNAAPLTALRSSAMPPPMLGNDKDRGPPATTETSVATSLQELIEQEKRERASVPPPAASSSEPPSSLEDAVMQELGERSPEPVAAEHRSSPLPPPIVEPSALKPRVSSSPPEKPASNPPATHAKADEPTEAETVYEAKVATPEVPVTTGTPADVSAVADRTEPAAPVHSVEEEEEDEEEEEEEEEGAGEEQPDGTEPVPLTRPADEETAPKKVAVPVPSSATTQKGGSAWWLVVIVGIALATWLAIRFSVTPAPPEPTSHGAAAEQGLSVDYGDVPPGVTVPDGQGWLAVESEDQSVLVDGVVTGRGTVGVPLPPGRHDVRVGGRDWSVDVRAGQSVRVHLTP